MMPGRVLDVAALVDIAVAKTNYSRSIVTTCLLAGGRICIPATVYSTVVSIVPLRTKLDLFELVTTPGVEIDDLTAGKAMDIAEILDGSRDVTAGHVVWCSLKTRWPILTDRGDELRNYDPQIEIDPVP
ncbi:hypothetical protein Pth03_07560 [Planotetraspora thailandica]|uniref:Uncharacterized protein n=1 Tax=Planotetraspora thailandica TaxID=487172 RepID=A0A8J3UVX0_9ACTN|nr:hypothetical protein [Planotetraspora thailandica]GII52367.1 hypothetical protein Pth03_07560 [Planotetraspora thailandica]